MAVLHRFYCICNLLKQKIHKNKIVQVNIYVGHKLQVFSDYSKHMLKEGVPSMHIQTQEAIYHAEKQHYLGAIQEPLLGVGSHFSGAGDGILFWSSFS